MKFLFAIIAIFALTAQAQFSIDIDPIKAYTGFAIELGLDQKAGTDFTACATAIGKVQKDLAANKINTISGALGSFVNTMLGSKDGYDKFVNTVYSLTVDGPCNAWAHTVLFTLLNGNGTWSDNFWNHSTATIGRIAKMRDEYIAGKNSDFGKSAAWVLKVLFGVHHPKSLNQFLAALGNPKPTTTDVTVEIQKFVNLVATGWKLKTQITQEQVKKVYDPIMKQKSNYFDLQAEYYAAKTNLLKEAVVSKAFKQFGNSFRPIMNDVFTIGQPLVAEFKLTQSGFETLVSNTVHNAFINFPTFAEQMVKLWVQLEAGAPEEAAASFLALAKSLQ